MSHHFDIPQETLDITDAYCFAGAGGLLSGPRTVFGMNTSPQIGAAWDAKGYYELKIDTNRDHVEDLTFRATFPVDSTGTQHVQVAMLTGAAARDRDAKGTIITPPNATIDDVVDCEHGIKLFAGERLDPFYNFIHYPIATTQALATGTFPDYASFGPPSDFFANNTIRAYVLEVPVEITGIRPVNFWATTAYHDTGHNMWLQVQRAGEPNMTTFFAFDTGSAKVPNYNATVPTDDVVGRPAHPATDPASGIWGQVRDNIAAVVQAGNTYGDLPHAFPTARAYGAWAADELLPNVITFEPGTHAHWDKWCGLRNGKGLTEDIAGNIIKMVVNQDFSTGLEPGPVLDYFPYLSPPPAG